MKTKNNNETKRIPRLIFRALVFLFSVIFTLLGFSLIWCMRTWQHLNMDELVYELSAPLEGTGSDMIIKYVLNCIVPTVLIVAIVLIARFVRSRINTEKEAEKATSKGRKTRFALPALSFIFMLICVVVFWIRLDVTEYLRNMGDDSTFIKDNYVDAGKVTLTFPEKKRNLIYIFLESMETTYTGIEDGGGFKDGCIPELTQLSKENEDFSADDMLNGGVVLPGTTWTMGGMFAQTSGLPLKIEIGENMMSTQENFFPEITCIGDILAKEGYNQVLGMGSKIEFGGRKVYFEKHGDYTFHDYHYVQDNQLIPAGYYVFWGYEDEKLFDLAKNDLTELAAQDAPFNYTMLTVDTHFEDGYVCPLCNDEFGVNQYANVMACSSRQVTEFVEWIKQQDFYENTTIVISGDHTTMDADFCNDVDENYLRKTYTAIINPAADKVRKDENIQFSTLDMFPTTLAALGVTIEGDQLGLGVNLFSDKPTILEQYGLDTVTKELKMGSAFMNSLSGITISEDVMKQQGWTPNADIDVTAYDDETKTLSIEVRDIVNMDDNPKVYATLYTNSGQKIKKYKLKMNPDRNYTGEIDIQKLKKGKGKIIVTAKDKHGTATLGKLKGYLRYQAHEDVLEYINLLKDKENIAILIGMRTEAIEKTQDVVFDALKNLGVNLDLKGNKGMSFYSVIEGDKATEEMSSSAVSYAGTFDGDDESYSILSAAKAVGDKCVITIKDKEYVNEKRGIYFVIYDTNKHAVVDKASFNISPAGSRNPICTANASVNGQTAVISLTDFAHAGDVTRNTARIEMWSAKNPDKIIKSELIRDEEGNFQGDIDISSLDTADCYVKVYVTDDKTRKEKLSVKWHGNLEELKDYRYIKY